MVDDIKPAKPGEQPPVKEGGAKIEVSSPDDISDAPESQAPQLPPDETKPEEIDEQKPQISDDKPGEAPEPTPADSVHEVSAPEPVEVNEEVAPKQQPDPEAATTKANEDTPAKEKSKDHHGASHHQNSGANMTLIIVLAILVALVLIGLGYAAYLDDSQPTDTTQNDQAQAQTTPADSFNSDSPLNPEDIDSEISDVEQTIQTLNDSTATQEDLSDEALGL